VADNTTEHKWTMIVDLDKCTGCQACVVACHAENNVPMASEDQVVAGRAFHWLRIERYWEGEYPNIQARFLPVLCQQCGKAPCEPVCPVYASYHSRNENINMQVYNRCIGTRFCNNNCPYKVRVFNYYPPHFDAPLEQQLNPEVTVRGPGVMEKCNFCIQRIMSVRETADAENRPIRDGEVTPACVQSCPTTALYFGDKYDENSVVSQMIPDQRQFKLLEQLGTEPSIYYLRGGESNVGE
jgi:Fe-S-cluster-containing dehydrogenase component